MAVAAATRGELGLPRGLLPAPGVDLRRAARVGALFGIVAVFVSAVGMVEAFQRMQVISPWLDAAYGMLILIGVGGGFLASLPPKRLEGYEAPRPGPRNVLAGGLGGAVSGAVLGGFLAFVSAVDVRGILDNVSPDLIDFLRFGGGTASGAGVAILAGGLLGAGGGVLHLTARRWRAAIFVAAGWVAVVGMLQVLVTQVLGNLGLVRVAGFLFRGTAGGLEWRGAVVMATLVFAVAGTWKGRPRRSLADAWAALPTRRRPIATLVALLVVVVVLGALPQVLGNFLSSTMDVAGTFLLMALGLNIVLGIAGLLDLGYVAFFAVGAYATAVLTSPDSPKVSPELIFWGAVPFIMLAAAVAGLVVGAPVLRMRGDYLAIVTLGFGEIARLIAQSDWQEATLGAAQGIARIPAIPIGPVKVDQAQEFFYVIFGFVIVFTYITYALQNSRLGRAWNAIREDEVVAEAMGVNTVAAKLWAFVLGAIMASLGGALYAHRITTVYPHDFDILVSITVVVVVIVGGMGSVPGVVLSAFVLVGLPDILREFEEFKFLIYGAILIFMMLKRPEGFIPSRRRARELREDERLQDAWPKAEARRQEIEEGAAPEAG